MSGPASGGGGGDGASSPSYDAGPGQHKRRLGSNELFCNMCHSQSGNLNVMCGLTLLTRQAIDEGKYTAQKKYNESNSVELMSICAPSER